ncbi:M23 family metallopeptidase [Cryobacterium cryoconiti]|uniref:M23ase beta-sheet core domain-containing protein n=1 Tax=Cryobacterium cryoconiti TaxID=1259239 RepID=A0A4Y8JU07_9MICO|nr:M23 family metallopeptidase [Cryobacterium cryoconiti]TFD29851.1 hypothetical protein E3T49_08800 [Cryobacterium cryoconiti]
MNFTLRAHRPTRRLIAPAGRRPTLALASILIVALALVGVPQPALADDTSSVPGVEVVTDTNPPEGPATPTGPEIGPAPSAAPTPAPPEPAPSPEPTQLPAPTPAPTLEPTPTPVPTLEPTPVPTLEPTPVPTLEPTPTPTPSPTPAPAPAPTLTPTPTPDATPTPGPSTPPAPPTTAPPPAPAVPPATKGPAPTAEPPVAQRDTSAEAPAAQAAAARAAAAKAAATADRRAAEQTAADQARAQHAAAYSAALTLQSRAQDTYDAAKLIYATTRADYDATVVQADLVRGLGAAAAARAEASRRALATLVRATLQQSAPDAMDVLLAGDRTGNDLLAGLATIDTLDRLTNSLDEVKARVDADTRREKTLQDQDAALRSTIEAIPLADTRLAMEEAQQQLDAAIAEVADLAASTPVALSLTPLPEPEPTVVAGSDDDDDDLLRGQPGNQGWAAPAHGSLSDGFGPRPDRPLPGVNEFHGGTDIAAECGAAVYAASAGVVAAAERLGTYGNWILIDHGNGAATGYAHLAEGQTVVSVGESVIAGQVIASVGSTGASTGCHLHFEVRVNGAAVDPQPFLLQRGVRFE